MPRQRGQKQNFQFNKGWNTEASALTFPENTASDLDNVILDTDGSVRRRLGVACESETSTRYLLSLANEWTTKAVGFFKWENVAGQGDLNFLVSQSKTTLLFHKEDNTLVDSIDFSDLVVTGKGEQAAKNVVNVSSGLGYLFVTGKYIDPFYCSYSSITGQVLKTSFTINIRDFDGVNDALDVDERPDTLSQGHLYNLRNQGWLASFPCDSGTDPVERTKEVLGSYPSNADILSYGKVETADAVADLGQYDPSIMERNVFGTSPAPRGKYILNAFNKLRSSVSDVTDTGYNEILSTRPGAVAFHNGRFFYAGLDDVGYTGRVYYSQQITQISNVGKCYQENDPTAEEFNELLATDGGELIIPGCGNIVNLSEGPSGILVFSTNGVWEITGAEGKFSATDFYVRKVTSLGCVGGETVINADGNFFYFSNAGIVGTSQDKVTGNISADVITTDSIQTGYLLFGGPQRQGARGTWIRGEKKAVWLYSTDTEYDGLNNRFKYNGFLILDTVIGSFYKYSISDFNAGAAPYISGIVETSPIAAIPTQENVTDSNGVDVTAGGVVVTLTTTKVDPDVVKSVWKLQCVRPATAGSTASYGIDFATLSSRTYTDWWFEDYVGADYTSYLETGYDYSGQAMLDKKPTYVHTYMNRVSKSQADGFYNIPDPTPGFDADNYVPSICYFNPVAFTHDPAQVVTYPEIGGGSQSTVSGDGTKYYKWAAVVDEELITSYTMVTPFDLTTGVADGGSLDLADMELLAMGGTSLNFSGDGLNLYISESNLGKVAWYSLSSPWDISSAGFRNKTNILGGQRIHKVQFSSDGATMIIIQNESDAVLLEYSCSSAFDPSSAVATGKSYEIAAFVDGGDFDISPDGTKLYLLDHLNFQNPKLLYCTMTTPFDISTITENSVTALSPTLTGTGGGNISIMANGAYLYVFQDTSSTSTKDLKRLDFDCNA